MVCIDRVYFNYCMVCRILCTSIRVGRRTNQMHIMKNQIVTLAVSLALTGAAAYLLSRTQVSLTADSLVGLGAVAALLAVVGLEYRITWKSLFSR